jgi:PAS domain S-box-containing protein
MAATRIRILHVEDVPADAELAERELRQAGFEIDIRRVETREAFLAALADFAPDLILSDYRLPEFDGMQALRLAKEHSAETPVIITTGSVNEETAVECMKAGAVDYVLKEQLGRLGTAVRSALEAQRLRVERRRAEKDIARLNAELEEALAWQRHIFEGSRDAVFVTDVQARFVAVNGAATEMTGYSREELLGMGIPDLHEEPDLAAYRAFHQRILGGEQILSEAPIRKKDGSKVAVEFNNRLVTIGGQRFMHTAGRDITKRKQLEAQLVQAQRMEAVGRLAGGVAHDFNNLLTVIQGYGELLAKSLEGDPEKRESMGEIVKAAERAAALTRQLLAFSRRQVLEMRVLDLGAVVADTEKMLRRLIGEDVEVVVVRPARLGHVKADPGQIEQVLLNLAVNSRDAMPGGGRLTLELADVNLEAPFAASHDSIPSGRYVVVSVRDTGSGMDAETLVHIFEPFFTTKEKGKGTGLGLAMVYGIVRQSGGFVDVVSAPGAGTTIRVYLPRSDARTTSGIRPRVSSRSGSETVLVVEDEAAVRNLVRAVLERKGYVVLAAQDGAAALELADKHAGVIHVLLTDLVMPGMNGRDLAERVRARRPTIKVLFMSGYTADVPAEIGTEGGPAFLSKPFNELALTVKLREVLDTPPA